MIKHSLRQKTSFSILSFFIPLAFIGLAFSQNAYGISASEIIRKADLARGLGGDFSMIAKVVTSKGNAPAIYKVDVSGDSDSLVEQTSPDRDAGRKFLMKEYDLFLLAPGSKRTVRIPFSERLTGEVATGDISRTNFAVDYEPTLIGEEKIKNKKCFKLELKAKNNKVTYSKIEYWVEKTNFLPVQSRFYALSGKLLKSAEYGDFKKVGGRTLFTKTIIRDALNKEKTSILIYAKHKKETFDANHFNKEAMGF